MWVIPCVALIIALHVCALYLTKDQEKESDMPTKPTIEQLREIAHMYAMHMSDADLESFRGLMG